MVEEFEIIRANLLPAAGTITDNDMILIIQGDLSVLCPLQ